MPTYTDSASGKSISSTEPLTDAEIEEAFGGTPAAPATETTSSSSSTTIGAPTPGVLPAAERFVGTVGQTVLDVADAASRLESDVGPLSFERVIGAPPAGDPARSGWDVAKDVGTVGGATFALPLVAGGTAVKATARATGLSPQVAENLDLATQLLTGGAQTAKALYEGAKSAAPAVGKFIKGLTEGGSQEAAGETLQETAAPALRTAQKATQAATFGAEETGAAEHGLAITPGSPEADQLSNEIRAAQDKWGASWNRAERTVAEKLLTDLNPKPAANARPLLYDATGAPIASAATEAAPVTYDALGAHYQGLQKIKGASSLRGVIGSAMDRLAATAPDVAEARTAGQAWWGGTGKLQRYMARQIEQAPTPLDAFNRTVGKVRDAARAGVVRDALADYPEQWKDIQRGFYSKIFGDVTDGKVALGKWNKLPEEVRGVYDPEGAVGKELQRLVDEGPGRLARGIQWTMTKAPHAGVAASAWHNPLALVYAATNLLKAPVGAPGRLATGLAAAAGPLARTGAAVSSKALSGLSDVFPTPPESAPITDEAAAPEQTAPAPEPTPSPPPAPTTTGQPRAATDLGGGTFHDQAMRAADIAGVPRPLMAAVMAQESAGRPGAVNPTSGAYGLMQLMPGTFAQYAPSIEAITGRPASIRDPVANLLAGAMELRRSLEASGGSVLGTAARYYGGQDPRQHGPKTAAYSRRILERVRGLMA